jgi:ATP-dependent protease HslVU (ClpYQ) peptidase subunit
VTCIVGWVENGIVYLGADSAGMDTNTYAISVQRQPKVFYNGPMIIGYTTSFRMGQLLEHALVVPPQTDDESIEHYMVTTFMDTVRDCLKSHGWSTVTHNNESGGQFLVGYRGRLFVVESQFNVLEAAQPYAAIGCAEAVASGALCALKAAAACSAGVRGPFTILQLGGE